MTRRDVILPPDRQALKVASRELVRAFGGTDAAGEALGQRQQKVSDLTLQNTEQFMTIDQVATLEDQTVGLPGHPHVTRALAARHHLVLVRLPSAGADPTGDVNACAVAHAKESNDVTTRLLAAGRLSRSTVREFDLVREARENVEASVKLLAMLEAIEGGDE